MKYIILSLILFSLNAFSVRGYDDRFYIKDTKWGELLNGIVKINKACTGFPVEGDVIISAAHCFKKDIDLNKDGVMDMISAITKDSKIDYKKLKKVEVRFGDANFDKLDKTKETHFDNRSEVYRIKDLFLAHDSSQQYRATRYEKLSKDYALIKLEKEIPKNIKRFKIFHPDLLKDYEILKHSYKGRVSAAGYHGDNSKTRFQRVAHIGCKIRDRKQYKKIWIEYSDCDSFRGASGGPLFYILRHKKTKKIELALRSILLKQSPSYPRISPRGSLKEAYRIGYGKHYYSGLFSHSVTGSLLITNHQEFLTHLKKFKKDSSIFRNQKLAGLEESKYLNQKWIYENIIQKKSLKELKEFVKKDLIRLSVEYSSGTHSLDKEITKIVKDNKFKIAKDKKDYFLSKPFDEGSIYWFLKTLHYSQFYPYQKRSKRFSKEKVFELVSDPDQTTYPFEDSVKDKQKAKKLWKMYFRN